MRWYSAYLMYQSCHDEVIGISFQFIAHLVVIACIQGEERGS